MKEIFPAGSAYESPREFFRASIEAEKKALEVYPESKVKKALEAISSILFRKVEESNN